MAAADELHAEPRGPAVIDDAFYRQLLESFSGWESRPVANAELKHQCQSLLEREARLLDQGRFEEWLGLYAAECLYWVPATPAAGDPRREVAVAFDDRRRLEDRIFRLRTGYAWSQTPPSRTVRLLSGVEVFGSTGKEVLMVRSSFLISEFRAGATRLWSGWCGYRLKDGKIEVKQVNLIDCDQALRNPSLIF